MLLCLYQTNNQNITVPIHQTLNVWSSFDKVTQLLSLQRGLMRPFFSCRITHHGQRNEEGICWKGKPITTTTMVLAVVLTKALATGSRQGCSHSARLNALLDWQIKEVVHSDNGWVSDGLETPDGHWILLLTDDILTGTMILLQLGIKKKKVHQSKLKSRR